MDILDGILGKIPVSTTYGAFSGRRDNVSFH